MNKMNELFKIAETIADPQLRAKYLEILRDSTPEKLWMDKYHLTMAQTSFLAGTAEKQSVSEMFIRANPFGGAYTVVAGLGPVLEWLADYGFSDENIAWLAADKNADGSPTFTPEFLKWLQGQNLSLTIDAMPEGELVFPNEPIVRVSGPKWQVDRIEGALLNGINASCLIATKAARINNASAGRAVMEFGLRRAQDMYGMRSTRSAAVGGIVVTSNADAAKKYNLKWVGTHAHSFVMEHDTELAAFEEWLRHNPNNATVLVDTYDTIAGVKTAIQASKNTGVPLKGIRLDSGDLAHLSIAARMLLNSQDANLQDCKILASNDLDEYTLESLYSQGAKIDIPAVGTKLVTGGDQASLGGVYKLKSIDGVAKMKISGDVIKQTIPGATETIRMLGENGMFDGDVITSVGFVAQESGELEFPIVSIDLASNKAKTFPVGTKFYKPAVRVVTNGVVDMAHAKRDVSEIARQTNCNLYKLDDGHKRLLNAHRYVAGLEKSLFMKRLEMTFGNAK